MRLFSGMGLVAADGEFFYGSSALDSSPKPPVTKRAILDAVFDGREPCVWHRLLPMVAAADTVVNLRRRRGTAG
jgi:hypothetical protein